MKLYVGNMSFDTTETQLRDLFAQHGEVRDATIVMDRDTGRPRGFGFIEFTDSQAGKKAIEALNGQEFGGRSLTVNEAKPRESRSGSGGYGGGGGGGRGRGGW